MAQTEMNDPFMAVGGQKPGNVYKMHKSILGGFGTFLNPFHFTVSLAPQKMKKPKLPVLPVTSDARGKPSVQINLANDSNVRSRGAEFINKISHVLLTVQFNISPEEALNINLCEYRGKLNQGLGRMIANARIHHIKSCYSKKRKDGNK